MNRRFAMKAFGMLAAAALATTLFPGAALAATQEVGVGDNFFEASAVEVKAGDTIHWSRLPESTRLHNVASTDGLFRSGEPTTGAIDFAARFSAGTFPYVCEIHSSMIGTITVTPKVKAGPKGLPFTVIWAAGTERETGTMFDVQYRVGTKAWKTWKNDTTAGKAVFGKRDKPIRVRAGKTYAFQVISLITDAEASDLSPIATFKP